jgi:hypothetical protein
MPLLITEKIRLSGPTDKPYLRALYCGSLADYYEALNILMESPAKAQDFLQKSIVGFRQISDKGWVEKIESYSKDIQSNRYCWMCNRKMQGKEIFYRYYPARIERYHHNLIENLKQDIGMVDNPGYVTLCTVCGTVIQNQADIFARLRAKEVRDWVEPILANHNQRINDLVDAVNRLNSSAHHH